MQPTNHWETMKTERNQVGLTPNQRHLQLLPAKEVLKKRSRDQSGTLRDSWRGNNEVVGKMSGSKWTSVQSNLTKGRIAVL